MNKTFNYYSYLLRFWRDDEHSPWRATLEDPHTGQSFGFASMEHLYRFLDDRALEDKAPEGPGNGEAQPE